MGGVRSRNEGRTGVIAIALVTLSVFNFISGTGPETRDGAILVALAGGGDWSSGVGAIGARDQGDNAGDGGAFGRRSQFKPIGETCSAAAFDSKIPQERAQAGRQLLDGSIAAHDGVHLLIIPYEGIRFPQATPYISTSVQERGIDGLARTNLRFS